MNLKLFERRLRTVIEDNRLQTHQTIIEQLGVDGMSSDESDHDALPADPFEPQNPQYHVLPPKFRAKELHSFLTALDRFYIQDRKVTNALQGNFPRHRIFDPRSPSCSHKPLYIDGLPINAYDPQWLQEHPGVTPAQTPYNFSYDPSIFAYSQQF